MPVKKLRRSEIISPKSRVVLRLPFQQLLYRGVGECTTPFPGLLHFTLETYLIKQGGIKYHFWVFGMTRPGIEPRLLANNLSK